MKRMLAMALLSGTASAALAAAPEIKPSDMTCEQIEQEYELTAEGRERLRNLIGACDDVVEIDGELYVSTHAVVRAAGARTVRLYVPANDRTFEPTPDADARVIMDGRKIRPSELQRGDQIDIHLAVNAFAEPRPLESVGMVSESAAGDTEQHVEVPVTELAALPTTGSMVPTLALAGFLLLGAAALLRRLNRG